MSSGRLPWRPVGWNSGQEQGSYARDLSARGWRAPLPASGGEEICEVNEQSHLPRTATAALALRAAGVHVQPAQWLSRAYSSSGIAYWHYRKSDVLPNLTN